MPARGPRREARAGNGRAAPSAVAALRPPRILLGFVIFEIACQVFLLFPAFAGVRVFVRTAAFGASALLALFMRGPGELHPSWRAALGAVLVMVASIFHPDTSSVAAGVATTMLSLAILGPVFWVPRLRIDTGTVRMLVLLLWGFHTASAAFGALQVNFPGRFEPAAASVYSDQIVSALHITLANGTRVVRPMGLTDTPGGAGQGAAYAIILAMGLLLERPRLWFQLTLLGSMAVACFTLYLSQVRSVVVMVVVSLLAMVYAQTVQRRVGRFALVATVVSGVAVAAFSAAVAIGGDAVTGRLSTLIDSSPEEVYYTNRGVFLEHTFSNLLPQYPLGAGMGRWGMMQAYFGDRSNAASTPIWAEIQWTGWLLDGGVPLMVAQTLAIFLALREIRRFLVRRDLVAQDLRVWATTILAYSVGAAALTFNSCPFASTMGIDFWILNATLFAAISQAA